MKNPSTKKNFKRCCKKVIGYISIIMFLAIISGQANALKISEIMFNPQGADSTAEWIEISFNASDGCLNLSRYRLNEQGTNHNMNARRFEEQCSYAIICDDADAFLARYPYLNDSSNSMLQQVSIYESTFSLSNSGENISIRLGNDVIDGIDYRITLEQANISEGHSLEYDSSGIWKQSMMVGGNPGNMLVEGYVEENLTLNNSINSTINESNIYPEINLENHSITYNNTYNNTLNLTINSTDSNFTENISMDRRNDRCNVSIRITLKNESQFYEDGTQIKFANKLDIECARQIRNSDIDYSLEYWIEDLQGNIVKTKTLTSNQDDKSFTPQISERDSIVIIRSELKNITMDCIVSGTETSCVNMSIMNRSASKIILIRDSDYVAPAEKTCPICSSKSTSSSSSSKSSGGNSCTYIPKCAICNQTQTVKTILFCNESLLSRYQQNTSQISDLKSANSEDVRRISANTTALEEINNSNSNAHSQITGAIIYESPNVKNRFYALIGLVVVGLACAGIIVYNKMVKGKS